MDLGVFCPVVNNHNVVSKNLNHCEPTWELNRQSYLTSHQVFDGEPNVAKILVARYHDELRRTPDGWKISSRVASSSGASREPRAADQESLSLLGGRGPEVWPRG
jgi:hypothetical protein